MKSRIPSIVLVLACAGAAFGSPTPNAPNLLVGGDIERGMNGAPAHWTFIGKSDSDWTAAEIQRFHDQARPDFSIGRAIGKWEHENTHSGKGALSLQAVSPPLLPKENANWHGRNPVDGYWLSDSMACHPGEAYCASAWIYASRSFDSAWFGPLEIRFYDHAGRQLSARNEVRSGMFDQTPLNAWAYCATMPYVAPEDAVVMRLRFGQELCASSPTDNADGFPSGGGDWGTVLADDLAVWRLPSTARIPAAREVFDNPPLFIAWFRSATSNLKPPIFPCSEGKASAGACWCTFDNKTPGNLFYDSDSAVPIQVSITNLTSVPKRITPTFRRTDWRGNETGPYSLPPQTVGAYATSLFTGTLPSTHACGAFYICADATEEGAVVASFTGRYAVLPRPAHRRSVPNIWGVTPLYPIFGDDRASDRELAEIIRAGGFGLAWVRLVTTYNRYAVPGNIEAAKREIAFYRRLGISCVLQIYPQTARNGFERPLDLGAIRSDGAVLGNEFKDFVAAIGDWGIEESNHRTQEQAIYRPLESGKVMTDGEYDQIMAALYDGIKSTAPNLPVLIGNIATTMDDVKRADTIHRLYGPPVNGHFDGAIMNVYWGEVEMIGNAIAEMDRHGDTTKQVWQEENSNQRSPASGPDRREREGRGACELVRWRILLASKFAGRIRSVTQWGLVQSGDWAMVTPALQPRPQFVAQAVMADTLSQAKFASDRSDADSTAFEWRRGADRILIAWAARDKASIAVPASGPSVTIMDVMGNRSSVPAQEGSATVPLTHDPIYIFE